MCSYLNINSAYLDIDEAAEQAMKALETFEDHLYDMKVMLDASITSAELTQNELNAFIGTISSARTNVNTKISTLNNKISGVDDARDSLDGLGGEQYH